MNDLFTPPFLLSRLGAFPLLLVTLYDIILGQSFPPLFPPAQVALWGPESHFQRGCQIVRHDIGKIKFALCNLDYPGRWLRNMPLPSAGAGHFDHHQSERQIDVLILVCAILTLTKYKIRIAFCISDFQRRILRLWYNHFDKSERRAYDKWPQHDVHQHHTRPGGEQRYQQGGQDLSPARDRGRHRSTRPRCAAAFYGTEDRRYDLRGVISFQHHQPGNHDWQNQPSYSPGVESRQNFLNFRTTSLTNWAKRHCFRRMWKDAATRRVWDQGPQHHRL